MNFWRSAITGALVVAGVVTYSVIVFFWSRDSCPVGTFPCSENRCVPQRSVCNKYQDCPKGEDEDPVLCMDLHGSVNMVLNTFNQGRANIAYYDKIKFECDIPLPSENCTCKYRYRLICKNIGLEGIPQGLPLRTTHLILPNNSIELEKNSFDKYEALEVIHLEGNHLEDLPAEIFRHQQKLLRLFLMHNNITTLRRGVFTGLSRLLWLMVNNNLIECIENGSFEPLQSVEWIDLSHNRLTLEAETFPALPRVLELFLNYNNIPRITKYTFAQLASLELLNLHQNRIVFIESYAFSSLVNLRELNLDGNRLMQLDPGLFSSQTLLSKLYLGNNPLRRIPSELFSNLNKLASLNLVDIEIDNIDVEIFSRLKNLESVYFKKYHYCAFAPSVPRCRPLSDGVSSTHQLLEKPILRYATWMTCIVTFFGNVVVVWGRSTIRDENKVLSLLIRNLAASDLLMGFYLLIIGFHDVKFRDIYNQEAQFWMSSWLCTFSGILAMISSEVSVLLLVFMSLERFLIIAVPYSQFSSLTFRTAAMGLVSIWTVGIAIAVIPVIEFSSSTRFYGLNGLCFPLHIDEPFFLGWKYTAVIMLGINGLSLIIIMMVYIIMFISIWQTRHATSVPLRDFEFAIKFFFIVITDASCWFPIILVKILALLGMEISRDVYAWLVVFVLPINSAVNPILYTFTTPKYRSKVYQISVPLHLMQYKNIYIIGKKRRPSPQSNMDTGSTPTMSHCGINNINATCDLIKKN